MAQIYKNKALAYSILTITVIGLLPFIAQNVAAVSPVTVTEHTILTGAVTGGAPRFINQIIKGPGNVLYESWSEGTSSSGSYRLLRSTDNAVSWSTIQTNTVICSGGLVNDVHVGYHLGIGIDNVMYTVCSRFVAPSSFFTDIAKSTDSGLTFSLITATPLTANALTVDNCIIVKDATHFKIWGRTSVNTIAEYSSTDGGTTLTGPTTIFTPGSGYGITSNNQPMFCNTQEDGVLAYTFPNNHGSAPIDDQLVMIATTDSGDTHSTYTYDAYAATAYGDSSPPKYISSLGRFFICVTVDEDGVGTAFNTAMYLYSINPFTFQRTIFKTGYAQPYCDIDLDTHGRIIVVTTEFPGTNGIYASFFNTALSVRTVPQESFITSHNTRFMRLFHTTRSGTDGLYMIGTNGVAINSQPDAIQYDLIIAEPPAGDVLQGGTSPITAERITAISTTAAPQYINTKIVYSGTSVLIADFPCHDNGEECLYRSSDSGATWAQITTSENYGETIDVAPDNVTIFAVGTAAGTTTPMLTRASTNNGLTFNPVSSLTTGIKQPCVIATSTNALYVIGLDRLNTQGILYITSTNAGGAYTLTNQLAGGIGTPPFGGSTFWDQFICSQENNGKMAILASTNNAAGTIRRTKLFYTANFGTTWTVLASGDLTSPTFSTFDVNYATQDIIVDSNGIYFCDAADPDGTGANTRQYYLEYWNFNENSGSSFGLTASGFGIPDINDFCTLNKYNGNILVTVSDAPTRTAYVGLYSTSPRGVVIPFASYVTGDLIRAEKMFTKDNNVSMLGSDNTGPFTRITDIFTLYDFHVPSVSTTVTTDLVGQPVNNLGIDITLSYDNDPKVYVGDFITVDNSNVANLAHSSGNGIYQYSSNLNFIAASDYCQDTRATASNGVEFTSKPQGPQPYESPGLLNFRAYNSWGGHSTPITYTVDNKILVNCQALTTSTGPTQDDWFVSALNPDLTYNSRFFPSNPNSITSTDKWPTLQASSDTANNCLGFTAGQPGGANEYEVPYNYQNNIIGQPTSESSLRNCAVDLYSTHIAIAGTAGVSVVNAQGILQASVSSIGLVYTTQIEHDNVYALYLSGAAPKITKYHYANGMLTSVLTVNAAIADTFSTISPDGKYLLTWTGSSPIAHLYDTSNLQSVLILSYMNNIKSAKIDVNNNYAYALIQGINSAKDRPERISLGAITNTICNSNSTFNTNCPLSNIVTGSGSSLTNKTITNQPVFGGFIGNATNGQGAFGGFIIAWSNVFPTRATGAVWFFGILVVIMCIVLLYRLTESAVSIPFGAGIGVVISIGIGWLPIWFMFAITFLLIILIARTFIIDTSGGQI